MDDVRCSGSEKDLLHCGHITLKENCGPSEGAGVICTFIQLLGGTSSSNGNVWITTSDGYHGPVCDDGWGNTDAGVACR